MKKLSEYNKKVTEHNNISLNMKFFWKTKKFTEYKTSAEYENVSLNMIKLPLNRKMFLWIVTFFFEYKNMNFAPNEQLYFRVFFLCNVSCFYYGIAISKDSMKGVKSVYPMCHFVFFDKLKYEIRNKISIFVSILKFWDIKHETNWFFDFPN